MSQSGEDMATTLSQVPLFAGVQPKALKWIATAFSPTKYEPGDPILSENDETADFYVLVEGKAQVSRGGQPLFKLSPFEFFGELTAMGFQRSRSATVTAIEPSTCLVASSQGLQSVMSKQPAVAARILQAVRTRYSSEAQSTTTDW